MCPKKHDSRRGDVKHAKPGVQSDRKKRSPLPWFEWRPGPRTVILALLLAVAVSYGRSAQYEFVHDDRFEILRNPLIQDLGDIPRFFAMTAWGFQETSEGKPNTSNYYRPLQYVTYSILYAFAGLSPGAFHLFKVLLHLGNALLVFWILKRLVDTSSVALVLAMLFAVHPANSEAVCWISAITDVACTFCFLGTAALYLRFRETATLLQSLVLGLGFLMGIFYKETMVAIIPVLLVYELWLAQKPAPWMRRIRLLAPMAFSLVIYLLLRWHAMGGFVTSTQLRFDYLTPLQSIANQAILLARYGALFLFPYELNAFHVFHPATTLFSVSFLMGVAVLAALAVLGFLWGRTLTAQRRNLLILGAVWFLVSIGPVILMFKRIGANVFAERYIYLPSIGLCMIAGVALWWVWDHARTVFLCLVPIMLLAATVRTWNRIGIWRNEFSFLETTARQSPDADAINANLGLAYIQKGRFDEAEKYIRNAILFSPDPSASHYVNLGNILLRQNRIAEAAAAYEKVMQLRRPRDLDYARLGQTYCGLQRYDKAIETLSKGYQVNPNRPDICYYLGNALLHRQRYAEALKYLEAAKTLGFADSQKLTQDLYAAQRALASK
jgi:tetratricopeptide (TPR) repeat protein